MIKKIIIIILIILFSTSLYEYSYADWKTSVFKAGKNAIKSAPEKIARGAAKQAARKFRNDKDKNKNNLDFPENNQDFQGKKSKKWW